MRYSGIELIQVATSALITTVVVLVVVLNRPPVAAASGPQGLEQAAYSIGGVLGARYDADDDFLVVTVADATTVKQATRIGCRHVLPLISDFGLVTLFALYTESGLILSSWVGCE